MVYETVMSQGNENDGEAEALYDLRRGPDVKSMSRSVSHPFLSAVLGAARVGS